MDTEQREREAEERAAIPAEVVHSALIKQGCEELERSPSALAWSGLAGGLSMAASFIAEALLKSHLPHAEWAPLISKLGYPVGFLIVILGRQQLFTENTLTPIIPLLHHKKGATFIAVARLWAIVFTANIVGAHLAAWFLGNTPAVSREVQTAMHEIGSEAMRIDFGSALVKGIVAGWLIALVVWLTTAVDNAKFAAIAVPTYVVGLGSFTHIIAGSIEILFLVMTGSLAWSTYALTFMIPTLIGNSIGGVLLVAALNHAQVTAGEEE